MPIPLFAAFLIGFGALYVGYLLMPKPKQPKPPSMEDFKAPTADPSRARPVLWGSAQIKGSNVIYSGDRSRRKEKGGGGKK